jgi:NAD(P)-dependent dehydrogenase (short-subunit alcohol dehydrogenase family)
MNLDLASHWRLSKEALPLLKAGEGAGPGSIVIIGSNHANHTIPGCFPYNVAKAGLLGLVQSLAIEWGPDVRCAGIAPGFIDTPGNDAWFDSFPDPAAERLRTEQSHPVGRIGSVEEIGALCAFLSSTHGGFISGTTLLVDGGRSALMQDP